VGALLHDTGYIQTADENEGTGGRFTLTHITRSIDFTERFLSVHGFSEEDFLFIRNMILCTNINNDIESMAFSSPHEKTVAMMLGTADLLSQISDRNYLENLTLLYKEFKEGNVKGFNDELDLYRKTVGFFDFVKNRFRNVFGGMDTYMATHFKHRLNIDKDLYGCAVDKNAQYLKLLFDNVQGDIRDHLRRDGIIERVHNTNISST
jgi:hypothetical protein